MQYMSAAQPCPSFEAISATNDRSTTALQSAEHRITLSSACAALLHAQVTEGIKATPRGGVEVGGLLLGSAGQRGRDLRIDELVPVEIEHLYGPTFRPSPADLDRIANVAASCAAGDLAVVGFYRSRTREESGLRDSDHDIIAAIERGLAASGRDLRLFIILKQVAPFQMLAATLLRENGEWTRVSDASFRVELASATSEIVASEAGPRRGEAAQAMPDSAGSPPSPPFPRTEPAAAPPASAPTAPAAATAPAVAPSVPPSAPKLAAFAPTLPEVQPRTPGVTLTPPAALSWPAAVAALIPSSPVEVAGQREHVEAAASKRRLALLRQCGAALLIAAVSVGISYFVFGKRQPQTAPPVGMESAGTPRVGFSATRQGKDWKLVWDRAAVAALHPAGAVLMIRDGNSSQSVQLSQDELAIGTLLYTPQSGDIDFGLRVYQTRDVQPGEHIRVLDPQSGQHRSSR